MTSARPRWEPPKGAPKWDNDDGLEKMKEHLQTAVVLELNTIPLYLFAAFTIQKSGPASHSIFQVVKEEMLHLGLAGNILRSIGGSPLLYAQNTVPQFPGTIFYDRVPLDLNAANKATIKSFQSLERPEKRPELLRQFNDLLPGYQSIGEFYHSVEEGLKILDAKFQKEGKRLFDPTTQTEQFSSSDGSWYDDDMRTIATLDDALKSMELIVEQGEGGTGTALPPGERSHYQVFTDLLAGPDLDCYSVVKNPKTRGLQDEPVYPVLQASDAAYCYLLLTIEKLWEYSGPQRGNLIENNLMKLMKKVIRPIAQFLVKQPLTTVPNHNAAACFDYFPFQSGQALAQLKGAVKEAIAKYPNDLAAVGQVVDNLIDVEAL